ncbi:MAG TPA: allantoinase AllB [Streptosporangiaceae bacterium]|nr:allantoinase AllB [Streptosporangiaceae bacterium]
MTDLVFRARRVLTPRGVLAAQVRVRGGAIVSVDELAGAAEVGGAGGPAEIVELADDEVLIPGLVDTHVHVNEPGRADWEGFATATAAAAAGGVTTIIDMPLNSIPPTVDSAGLAAKRKAAAGKCAVDVGFWGGAVPGNSGQRARLHEAGVFGFKCFTADSGVPEFPPLDDAALAQAIQQVAELGSVLVVHAEDAAVLAGAPAAGGRAYRKFLASRPPEAEVSAVRRLIELAADTGARVHVLHLSAAPAVPLLAAAQADGVQVTAETCPHYLTLGADQVRAGQTQFKCCPPIRDRANQELLWEALETGVIGCVVSDHSPCPPELKHLETGDFATAWGGISSLQLGLPVTWTRAARRGHDLADVLTWMAANPARLAGLDAKGSIEPGRDADLVAFAPDETFVVTPDRLRTRHRLTPYEGQELRGVVRKTWLRGVEAGPGQPAGRLLTRPPPRP